MSALFGAVIGFAIVALYNRFYCVLHLKRLKWRSTRTGGTKCQRCWDEMCDSDDPEWDRQWLERNWRKL